MLTLQVSLFQVLALPWTDIHLTKAHEGKMNHRLANLTKIRVIQFPRLLPISFVVYKWLYLFCRANCLLKIFLPKMTRGKSLKVGDSCSNILAVTHAMIFLTLDLTDRFDFTFLCGDLNFRLDISRLHADWLISRQGLSLSQPLVL